MKNNLIGIVIIALILSLAIYFFASNSTSSSQLNESEIIKIMADTSPDSTAYNETSIKEIQKLIDSCKNSEIFLYYGLGSQNINLNRSNDYCKIDISGEIEMGRFSFECNVPIINMRNWVSWKNPDILTSSQPIEISNFCVRI